MLERSSSQALFSAFSFDMLERLSYDSGMAKRKNKAAQALGKLGGLKGGNASAKALSPERRKEIASEAAKARWGKKP
jgi:hypothetical protein